MALPAFWGRFSSFAQDAGLTTSPAATCAAPDVFSRPQLGGLAPALEAALLDVLGAIEARRQAVAAAAQLLGDSAGPARFDQLVHATVLATCCIPLGALCDVYYAQRLGDFTAGCGYSSEDDDGEDDGDEAMHTADAAPHDAARPQAALHPSVVHATRALAALGLGGSVEDSLSRVCAAALRTRLASKARAEFTARALGPTRRWLHATVQPYVTALTQALGRSGGAGAWHSRLEHALHTALGSMRIEELFDIIVDFPDSQPALADLGACLEHTTLAPTLEASFSAALQRRLLHAGAATPDILTQYINTIKALRELDPQGAILEGVSGPVRAYLRHRRDTIRCVVTMLTDDAGEGTSLMDLEADDQEGSGAPQGADADSDIDGDAAPPPGWDAWQPAAVHAASAPGAGHQLRASAGGGAGDVVGQLVGVFGSRELFVSEYRTLLADRLLSRGGYDTEREVRTLELLKVRFGDTLLHACEVMLKDIADSRRLDANVKQGQPAEGGGSLQGMTATVLSQLFWPPITADASADITLPPRVAAALKAYGDRFEALKAPRKLVWKPALGSVTMSLTLGGQSRSYTVSPGHATLICAFHQRDDWGTAQLGAATGMSAAAVASRAAFWVKAGVLVPSPGGGDGYAVAHAFGALPVADTVALDGGDAHGGAVASAEEQAAAEMVVYEQFVLGMLINFDSLPLANIHNMLRMFVADPPYDKSIQQLEKFLAKLVAEEKITFVAGGAGAYRRRK